jgi:hypothetical protein
MWIEAKRASNLMVAEMWKEFFEGEGIPCRILPDPKSPGQGEFATYTVLVPKEKDHVVAEILRKM